MSAPQREVRLLVVEDDPTNQEVAVRILGHLGYKSVEVAADGNEALQSLAERDFDLVLMDCHLPGLDGYETSRQIRRSDSAVRDHEIPIVATTAAAMESDRRKCYAAGMNGYVTKPLMFDALHRAVEQWTSGRRTAAAAPAAPPLAAPPLAAPPLAAPPLAAPPVAARPAAGAARPVAFDRDEFEEFLMGQTPLAQRILRKFVDDMPRQLALLARAVSDGDAPQVRLVAHSIKGAAASVSGQEIRDASRKLEQQGCEGDLAAAPACLLELSASFERARPMMESFCREE